MSAKRPSRLGPLRLPSGRAERAALVAAAGLPLIAAIAVVFAARLQDTSPRPGPSLAVQLSPQPDLAAPTQEAPPTLAPVSPSPTNPRATPALNQLPASSPWSLPDGLRYDLVCDDEPCALHLFDEMNREQDGWPVAIPGECAGWVVIGPKGSAFVPCNRNRSAVVTAVGRDGRPLRGWPATVPGSVAWPTWNGFSSTRSDPLAIGPDGTVYLAVTPRGSEGFEIHAFVGNGKPRRGWPVRLSGGAQGFAVAPDGVVVGWWYEGIAQDTLDLQARRTRFTMLDKRGDPLPGWPIGSKGTASGPVIWPNGGIAYTSATAKVWAHDRTGKVMNGWPYQLPYKIAPALRNDGMLLFVGDTQVHVVDGRGRSLPGWPWRTRATLEAPVCDTDAPSSQVYALAADDTLYLAPWNGRTELVALAPDGAMRPGWPYRLPARWRVTNIAPAPEGTVTARLTGGDCFYEFDGFTLRLDDHGALIGDAPGTPLYAVYDALRLERLRTIDGASTYAQGRDVGFRFELVNRSSAAVTLPLVDYYGTAYYAAGTMQTWLERLGPDTETDCFPRAGRKEHWYATGGWIAVSVRPVTIQPGDPLPSLFDTHLTPDQTACLPPGDYRFHVEYKLLGGELDDVVAVTSLRFTIAGAEATDSPAPTAPPPESPPPPTPSPSPAAIAEVTSSTFPQISNTSRR